jgi:glycosyltransferase involved in cell wall biosynthesis
MRFSVCIPSVRTTTLEHAVRSVTRQVFEDWELVVIGQGDELALRAATERAATGDDRVRYVHSSIRGACAARNVGISSASGEISAFMDDDCEAAEDWLAQLDLAFGPSIDFVSGAVVAPPKAHRIAVCPTIVPKDVLWDSATVAIPPDGFGVLGANIAVRRTATERVGLFDECLGPGSRFQGGEEHDYVHRLTLLGARMQSTPKPVVHHTYGYRYGVREYYRHKRERLRGDGGLGGKAALLRAGGACSAPHRAVYDAGVSQLRTITLRRLPNAVFRLFHYLKSYSECVRGCVLREADNPIRAVLEPRAHSHP